MVRLNGLGTVIGAVYQNPSKPLVKESFDGSIVLSSSRKFIFGPNSIRNTPIGSLG